MVERHHRTRTRAAKVPSPPVQASSSVASQCAQALNEIKSRLEIISSTVTVAAGALEGQNAEIDLDVANTLRMSVRNALADQVERLSVVIQKLQ